MLLTFFMRKNVFGRQLKRDTNERKALFKGLASSLVLHERIETTEQKAKSIKGQVEKLVTKAKVGDQNAERLIQPYLNAQAVSKMMRDIAPRFKSRPGGYTRIVRMGRRLQDNASMVILEWVEKRPEVAAKPAKKDAKKSSVESTVKAKKSESKKTEKKVVKKAAKSAASKENKK
jgi:large subunit ribosomal protein L17